MATAITTVLDDDVLARLDALPDDRPREVLVAEAVRRFVDDHAALGRFVGAGETSIAEGRGLSHGAFVAAIREWRIEHGIARDSG
jgi:predicted transcriptional regulator